MYSRQDLENSFQLLLERAKWKRRVPLALSNQDAFINPALVSQLPIGSDGMKTITFLKNPDLHYGEILRKLKNHTEDPGKPYHFRPVRAQKKFTKSGKSRTIYCYSLVDQIVLKTVQQELKQGWGQAYSSQQHPMDTAFLISQEIEKAEVGVQILKVDITKFFPSIDRAILFADLKEETGIRPEVCRLIIAANSLDNTTGVVTGGSLSTLLSEFYLRNFKSAFPSEIGFHRFADDMCLVIPSSHNPEAVKQKLIDELAKLSLSLSAEKSKIIDPFEEEFEFLGINFISGRPVITEDEVEHWKSKVQQDVFSEKGKLRIYKNLNPELKNLPSGKEIQNTVWSQHLTGKRSRFQIKYAKYVRYFGPLNTSN
jgi:hypothetical protein